MNYKRWIVPKSDKELAKTMAEECNIDPITAYIAVARGFCETYELEQFLSNEPQLSDLHEINDIFIAAEILNAALQNGDLIAVYGDYDCDGVVATSIMCRYLSLRKANYIYYIPDRFNEGYGMNIDAVEHLHKQGVKLIITVDNGISSVSEIKYAKELGMDVIVTDHHIPKDELPEADVIINPHRKDSNSSFKDICGAFVAYKLVCAAEAKEPEELINEYADFLAVATIGDVMPLINENRSVVKYGLKKMISNPSIGFSALLNVSGIDRNSVSASKVAYGIVPRVNAAGRMGNASRTVELLLSDNMLEALKIANELDSDNTQRQNIEKEILDEACDIIEKNGYQYNRVIVVDGENWHCGIVGICASRLVEKYGRPTIVLSKSSDEATGSGRSYKGFSLFDAVSYCSDLLTKFGGHELAAGVSLSVDNINDFREKINEYAINAEPSNPEIRIDCRIKPAALTVDLAFAIKELEPFGNGNPTPLFGIFSVVLTRILPIGSGKHLRLMFEKNGVPFQALLFSVTPEVFPFECGDTVDIAVNVDVNNYKDNISLSVIIKAIRISGVDEEKIIFDKRTYDDFKSGYNCDTVSILPTRGEVGEIYKFVNSSLRSEDMILNRFISDMSVSKILVSIDTLKELGLINLSGNFYSAQKGVAKTDLKNSDTYAKLLRDGDI